MTTTPSTTELGLDWDGKPIPYGQKSDPKLIGLDDTDTVYEMRTA